MSKRAKKPCNKPGCGILVDAGISCCKKHINIKKSNNKYKQYKPVDESKPLKPKRKPPIDWNALNKLYIDKLTKSLAFLEIGVEHRTLNKFGMGWTGDGFTFPMVSPTQEIIGMQVRFPNGRKLTMRGSSIGLFVPRPLKIKDRILLVAEGMSDTAVLTEMGYGAIGRYNCNSCIFID